METELNLQIKAYLKKVSASLHREIEQSIYAAIETAQLSGNEVLPIKVSVNLPAIDLHHHVSGLISLK